MSDIFNEKIISVLIPCLNEEKYIRDCILSVLSFVLPPKIRLEVFVIDGCSTDNTLNIIQQLSETNSQIQIFSNPGRIQSCALNLGIRLSRGKWIMRLDAHTIYPPDYLKLCYETAIQTGADNVGGVWTTLPGGDGYQAQLVQALTTHKFGVGNSGFRVGTKPGPKDTVPFGFFRREVFERIGFFDERLVRTQDYEFNQRIKKSGGNIYMNPEIQSTYYNQPDLLSFFKKQLFKQGPYNAYMWYLAPYAFTLRHSVTFGFAIFFWMFLVLSQVSETSSILFLTVLGVYFSLGTISAYQQFRRYGDLRHLFTLPGSFFLFHLCHGTGGLIGLVRLLTRTAPVLKISEPWPGAGRFRALSKST